MRVHAPSVPQTATHERFDALAERFADEWDQTSFDPDYPTKPLEHFEPMVREVFARAKTPIGS